MFIDAFRASAFGAVVSLAISAALAQQPALITRSVPRDPTPHVMGHAVLSPAIVTTWGGVVAQAHSLTMHGEPLTDVRLTLRLDEPDAEGLRVDFGETTLFYPIDYPDLVPMALFVESGGTGLYTAFGDDRLGDGFNAQAGTVALPDHGGDRIALEFAGTVYEDALVEVDWCGDCLMDAPPNLLRQANAVAYEWPELSGWPLDENTPWDGSYVNTDFGSNVLAEAEGERLALTSTIARYDWSVVAHEQDPPTFEFDDVHVLKRPDRREITAAAAAIDGARQRHEAATTRLQTLAACRT